MKVCYQCEREMKCVEMGVAARYGPDGSHAYMGDLYRCPVCGVDVLVTNGNPTHSPGRAAFDIFPKEGALTEEEIEKRNNIIKRGVRFR